MVVVVVAVGAAVGVVVAVVAVVAVGAGVAVGVVVGMTARATTIYPPEELYVRLKTEAARQRVSLTALVSRYCEAGVSLDERIRGELHQAAGQIETDPDALSKIRQRIEDESPDDRHDLED